MEREPRCYPFRLDTLSIEYIWALSNEMLTFSYDAHALKKIFTNNDMKELLKQTRQRLSGLGNVTEYHMPVNSYVKTLVVGDIHGQFHDLMTILKNHGMPNDELFYVFNGDFVDRGSWGVEIVIVIFCLFLLYPKYVHLCRGNHETTYCTKVYGFFKECETKYSKSIYDNFSKTFSQIPLACAILPVVAGNDDDSEMITLVDSPDTHGPGAGVLVMHGGLFKNPQGGAGTLQQLMNIDRCDLDPQGTIVEDVLWSDPWTDAGQGMNGMRGCGICFGANVTAEFLHSHGLSLIVRSHEGPDARRKRPWIEETMMEGYAVDHRSTDESATPTLVTIFSAPNYPQGPNHCNNEACIMILRFDAHEHPDDNNDGDDDNHDNKLKKHNGAKQFSECKSCLRCVEHHTRRQSLEHSNQKLHVSVAMQFHIFNATATPDVTPYMDIDDDGAVTDKEQ